MRNFIYKLNGFIEGISGFLLAAMVFVTFLQVLARLVKGALPWSEEIARYMQVYLGYLGTSVVFKKGELVSVEILTANLTGGAARIVKIAERVLVELAIIILIIFSFRLVTVTMLQHSPVLSIPMGFIYLAILIGAVLMFIYNTANIIALIKGDNDEEETGVPVI